MSAEQLQTEIEAEEILMAYEKDKLDDHIDQVWKSYHILNLN